MYNVNISGWRVRGTVDNRREASVEMRKITADVPSVSVLISNRIQIWDRRQKVAVEI